MENLDRILMLLRMLVACCWRQVSTLQAGETFSDHPPRPGHNNMDDGEPGPRQGWQVVSSMSLEEQFVSSSLWPRLTLQSRALFRSQGGPFASLPFTSFPGAASGSLFPPLYVPAGVACHSTLVAATAQRAAQLGFWDVGVSRWRVQAHASVVRGQSVGDAGHGFGPSGRT